MNRNLAHLILLIVAVSLGSCSGVKFLGEGEKFYDGASIKFMRDSTRITKKELNRELVELLQPQPNAKILGSRPAVWFYSITKKPKKDKGFKYWVKYKLGKAPILASDVEEKEIQAVLKSYLINHGYFLSEVSSEWRERKHTSKITYTIHPRQQYIIRNILYPEVDSVYMPLIKSIRDESLLKEGKPYNVEVMQKEQKRIEDYLENHGFYYFDDNYLLYAADSTVGDHQVDLTLTLSKDTPEEAKKIFTIDEIALYPDYSITKDTTRKRSSQETYNEYTFINNDDYIRPDILTRRVVYQKGDTYSEEAASITREHLMTLGTYKFVNLKFDRMSGTGLRSRIYLTALPKKSLSAKLYGTSKSNNFLGPSFTISFQNRNTFRGAELLKIDFNTSYEVQVGGQNDPPLTAYEFNLESSLTIPRFISPFNFDFKSYRFIPNTKIAFGIRQQRRVNVYQINSLETKFGYLWRRSLTQSHELYPINVSYIQLAETSSDFEARLSNDLSLQRSLQNQFIAGGLYRYTYNSRNAEDADEKRNHFYLGGLVDVSGNLLSVLGSASNEEDILSYSQYAKVQLDFRHYLSLGGSKELASRLFLGTARAYGNSTDVPFIKQFSSGGANSIRAFQARSLGPGSFNANSDTSSLVLDEVGDIKMEANVEYRGKLVGVIEGALFLDAGNIWIWDGRPEKPGGTFDSDFLSEVAVGTGVGVRFNFSFFILRFDFAFPLRKPYLDKGDRWVFDEINPLNSDWRSENLILNIAIGYPF